MEIKIVKLVYGDSEIEIMCDEIILEGAYRNGLNLKYHCAAGHSGRCRLFQAKPGSIILVAYPARIFQQETF